MYHTKTGIENQYASEKSDGMQGSFDRLLRLHIVAYVKREHKKGNPLPAVLSKYSLKAAALQGWSDKNDRQPQAPISSLRQRRI